MISYSSQDGSGMTMNNPIDHHYLAVFYLSRWAGDDGCICRFSRPWGHEVKTKRVVPKGTGYEEHLYSHRQPEGPPIPQMEKDFMSKLDSEAAIALGLLESNLPESHWESRFRSAWSRFIWTQFLRNPSEVAQLKSSVKEAWEAKVPGLQKVYEEQRGSHDPESVDDYLATLDPSHEDRFALKIARTLMDHSGIGQIINNMHWKVLDFDGCGIPLLTSDRPVWMTGTLTEEDAFLSMPIGPTRLFVATKTPNTLRRLTHQKRRQQAKNRNKLTAQHAVKLVYGQDDKMLGFIQKHLATKSHSTPIERLAAGYGHTIVSPSSPMDDTE